MSETVRETPAESQPGRTGGAAAVRQLLIQNSLRKLLLREVASTSRPTNPRSTYSPRLAIREICATIDLKSQKAEQLLVAFKSSLNEAADDANIRLGPARNDLLARVVTIFIEELYRAPDRRTSGDGDGQNASRNAIPAENPS
jgi:hypothetical protein